MRELLLEWRAHDWEASPIDKRASSQRKPLFHGWVGTQNGTQSNECSYLHERCIINFSDFHHLVHYPIL